MTPTARGTLKRLALPWGAAVIMAAVIAVSAARGPAPSRAASPAGADEGDTTPAPAAAPSHTASPRTSPTAPSYPTIVRLVGRDFTIVVHAGHGRNLFSATRADGTPIASNLTLDRLRQEHPEIYRRIEPAFADADDHDAGIISWAGAGE